jgi:hypothetical protein
LQAGREDLAKEGVKRQSPQCRHVARRSQMRLAVRHCVRERPGPGGSRKRATASTGKRNRKFADSPLEGDGFEPSVPREMGYRYKTASCASVTGFIPERTHPFATGDRGFEFVSLQQTVRPSPASAVERREPRLSARVCAAGFATGSAETRRVFRYRANRRQYLCRAIFQYVQSPSHYGWKSRHIGEWACDVSLAGDRGFDPASSSGASGAKVRCETRLSPVDRRPATWSQSRSARS